MYFFDQIFELFVLYRFFFAFPFAFLGNNLYFCKVFSIIQANPFQRAKAEFMGGAFLRKCVCLLVWYSNPHFFVSVPKTND